ncbi:MAG: hypothetical protein OJF62_001376 [Pseudolabrys sp.]|jgi:hypothetical protein|nr:hypothetical protein [Pseudolabrys sp.]
METKLVMAGLDPAIHRLEETRLPMDARVKPAHDDSEKPELS